MQDRVLPCFEHSFHIFDPKHSHLTSFSIVSLYLFYVVDFSIKSDRNMFIQEMQRGGDYMKRSFTLNEE